VEQVHRESLLGSTRSIIFERWNSSQFRLTSKRQLNTTITNSTEVRDQESGCRHTSEGSFTRLTVANRSLEPTEFSGFTEQKARGVKSPGSKQRRNSAVSHLREPVSHLHGFPFRFPKDAPRRPIPVNNTQISRFTV
jgi:hypothetical protein